MKTSRGLVNVCVAMCAVLAVMRPAAGQEAQEATMPDRAAAATAVKESGGLKVNGVFADGAVLQRGEEIPVWGTAGAGEEVTVKFRKQSVTGKADGAGRWAVKLGAETAGGPDVLTVSGGKGTVEVKDVLVGEVWLASGQSNMVFRMKDLGSYMPKEVAEDGEFRIYEVPGGPTDHPVASAGGQWKTVKAENARPFSAVAYFFGTMLRKELNVPVGIVVAAVGGSTVTSWLNKDGLDAVPEEREAEAARWKKVAEDFPAAKAAYDEKLAAYNERKKQVEESGGKFEEKAPEKPLPPTSQKRPMCNFNSKIAPIAGYGIRGVLWYQGESDSYNVREAGRYGKLLRVMIAEWRKLWNDPELPFLIVQLPSMQQGEGWVITQMTQEEVGSEPHNGYVTTLELGLEKNIHPPNKLPVGERLARLALADVYGKKMPAHPPKAKAAVREGKTVRVSFVTDEGVTLAGKPEGAPGGFEVAGADGVFAPAEAKIEGNAVIVSSESVAEPVKVRYAYKGWPVWGVFDSTGVPAGPFVFTVK